ncbi:uncharacterized protein LOC121400651 [Xenopus laevis]|uniref:Uncharacterized protein LOC121400651 n=1 Tax=Xenopus laevis TaxID=8355 RepID=A0A8J1MEK1_XENLA|nr:uncharacterized protein LOC121400651 [Xenopus laevis]
MGANMAPAYANIFMDNFEKMYIFSNGDYSQYIHHYMRYVDDTFFIWTGSVDKFHEFVNYLNTVHQTIKFTSEVNPLELHFLDVNVQVSGSSFTTTVYTKPTDRNNILKPSSFHPPGLFKGLPRSQFMRVKRITSTAELYNLESTKMVDKFDARGYDRPTLLATQNEVGDIPRVTALTKKPLITASKIQRIPFVTSYDTNSWFFRKVILRHWKVLSTDQKYGHLFKSPPIFSYRRGRNVGELIKRKPPPSKGSRNLLGSQSNGTFPCRNCSHCNAITPGSSVTHPHLGTKHDIKGFFTCDTKDVVYCLKCPCGLTYIGQTSRAIKLRLNEHKSNIRNYRPAPLLPQTSLKSLKNSDVRTERIKPETLLAKHFFMQGHQVSQLRWQVLEKVIFKPGLDKKKCLLQRECYWIWLLESRHPKGLNEEYSMACFL